MNYIPNATLQRHLDSGNLPLAREMLKVIMDNNGIDDRTVADAFDWAARQRPQLIEPLDTHVGDMDPDHNHWTAEYYFRQKTLLSDNFSDARIQHLLAVRAQLHANRDPLFTVPSATPGAAASAQSSAPTPRCSPPPPLTNQPPENSQLKKWLVTAAVVLLVAAAAVTLLK